MRIIHAGRHLWKKRELGEKRSHPELVRTYQSDLLKLQGWPESTLALTEEGKSLSMLLKTARASIFHDTGVLTGHRRIPLTSEKKLSSVAKACETDAATRPEVFLCCAVPITCRNMGLLRNRFSGGSSSP